MKKKIVIRWIVSVFIILFLLLIIFTIYVFVSLPNIDLDLKKLENYTAQVEILDTKGEKIVATSKAGQQTVKLSDLPSFVPQAFISIEDKNFYSHHGLNYKRIVKASIKNMISGYAKEGASTITQQLIKNTHLNSEKTFKRKLQEAILAKKLEKKYSKDDILNTYLNVIYFGSNTYGIDAAAMLYFNHPASQLSLCESATLAAIIKSPKTYSPILNPQNCKSRRNLVLQNMLSDGYITQNEYNEASSTPLSLNLNTTTNEAYFRLVINEATQLLNLSENDVSTTGLKIYTYINSELQNEAESLLNTTAYNSSYIVFDNKTNGVIAFIGDGTLNRQVGSVIKPILCYAPSIEKGLISPITPILDEKTNFNGYCPQNVDKKYHGWVSIRNALATSLNVPAVKVLSYLGIDHGIDFASSLGLNFSPNDNHLALALGASENGQNLLNITNAYTAFARLGDFDIPHFIKEIQSNTGKTLYKHKPKFISKLTSDSAFMINDILKDCVKIGTAKKLNSLNLDLCAKTGTVGYGKDNTNTDAWCISYNPNVTVGVWVGNTSTNPENNLSPTENGGTISAKLSIPLWKKLMNIYPNFDYYSVPDGVFKVKLDSLALQNQKIEKASKNTPEKYVIEDYFSSKYAPTKVSKNFNLPPTCELKITKIENNLMLSWSGLDYLNYELWCKNSAHSYKICSLSGKNKLLSRQIELPNEDCEFWLISSFKFNESNKSISNTVKFVATNTTATSKKILSNWLKKEPKP